MYIPTWLTLLIIVLAFIYIYRSRALIKKDKHLINLTIDFNLSAINDWLHKNGTIRNIAINKSERDIGWDKHATKRSYKIDIIPNGEKGDIFFHREKTLFSAVLNGFDCLENVNKNIEIFTKKSKIKKLEWSRWRQYLSLEVWALDKTDALQRNVILHIPLAEIAGLRLTGKFKEVTDKLADYEEKIKVPVSFDDKDKPKDYVEVWRRVGGTGNWITYSNALGSISAEIPNFLEVEY